MKKVFLLLSVILAVAMMTTAAFAAKNAPGSLYQGKVLAVDTTSTPNTITIEHKKQASKTFTITASTKIIVDKAPAVVGDIVVGMHARIRSEDGTTALRIHAHVPKPHIKK